MLERDPQRRLKVGLFTAGLLALLGLTILVIGKKQGMFTRHASYRAEFQDVAGLVPGAQVWLNGVVVGVVEDVDLPEDPALRRITVTFKIRRELAARVRADSRVRIRTLGLLGDRYLELSSGTPLQPLLPEGSLVPSVEPTDIAEALSQGGEAIGNVVAITGSLRRILEKMERGEGVLGALVNEPFDGKSFGRELNQVLGRLGEILASIQQGRGFLGKVVTDPQGEQLFAELQQTTAAASRLVARLEQDLGREDTALGYLLKRPEGRERLARALDSVARASEALAAASQELASGQGTLPRLLADKGFADTFLADLAQLTHSLAGVAKKLDAGQGSAGKFLNDPKLYDDLENVVRGVQQSSLLRWFVRNRRQAGEKAAVPTPGGG